ncbi:MAG: hypothetical protein RLZZ58_977 [Pseudomonadota bacterium]
MTIALTGLTELAVLRADAGAGLPTAIGDAPPPAFAALLAGQGARTAVDAAAPLSVPTAVAESVVAVRGDTPIGADPPARPRDLRPRLAHAPLAPEHRQPDLPSTSPVEAPRTDKTATGHDDGQSPGPQGLADRVEAIRARADPPAPPTIAPILLPIPVPPPAGVPAAPSSPVAPAARAILPQRGSGKARVVLPAVLAMVTAKRDNAVNRPTHDAPLPLRDVLPPGLVEGAQGAPRAVPLVAPPPAPPAPLPALPFDTGAPDSAERLAAHVQSAIRSGAPVDLALSPAHLGPVRISVTTQGDAPPLIVIVTATADARDWLAGQADTLHRQTAAAVDISLRPTADPPARDTAPPSAPSPGDPRGGGEPRSRPAPQLLPENAVSDPASRRRAPDPAQDRAPTRGRFA